MIKCDDEALAALLNTCDDVGEQDSDVAQHVESCQHCQSRLSELAADAEQWDAVSQWLSPGDVTSEIYAESLDARDRWKRPTVWTETMAKSLLSAASHPEMLGRIGRYDVERLIGSGGMGVVFKAYDTELNRPVAVKLLAPYLAGNGAARKRFAREARAAAAVVDDHVVPIHNVETEGEHPFLVMKYIGGGSLQQRLDREGPLEVCEVLWVGMQTAKGLAAAHAQGLIHRDVKPSNILLDEGVERALLTDFGLARAEDDACLTRSGFHPGTPHFMSPEQVRGETIDGRSDLFGLGCVLYALCTGHPPFRAETSYAVLRRITDTQPRPIRETNPDVPLWLEQIVMKLLAKSADNRFDSAAEVAELLEQCLAHVQQPTTTPLPESLAALASERSRRPPVSRFFVAAAFAVSLIFAGVLIVLELNKGTLTIESEVDNIPIRIMQGDTIVEQMTVTQAGTSTRVAAGSYVVELENSNDGLVIEGGAVWLMRGKTRTVKIVKAVVRTGDGSSVRIVDATKSDDLPTSEPFEATTPLDWLVAWDFNYTLLGKRYSVLRIAKDGQLEAMFPGHPIVRGKLSRETLSTLIRMIAKHPQATTRSPSALSGFTATVIPRPELIDEIRRADVRTEVVAVVHDGVAYELNLDLDDTECLNVTNYLCKQIGLAAVGGDERLTELIIAANGLLAKANPKLPKVIDESYFNFAAEDESGNLLIWFNNRSDPTLKSARYEMCVPKTGEPTIKAVDVGSNDGAPVDDPPPDAKAASDAAEVLNIKQLIERGQELSSSTAKVVTVRFPVLSAQRKGVIDQKGHRTELWFLSSYKDSRVVDPNVLLIEISASAEKSLRESGVSDIPGHFVGKTVAVTGNVRAAVAEVFSEPETVLTLSITVSSLDQIRVDDGDSRGR